MSGLITGLVLKKPLTPEYTGEMKFVAVVYADHAWQDGTHAYPSVKTVATETGFSERTVQRLLRRLERLGLLVPDGKGPRGTTNYKFPLEDAGDDGARLVLRPALGGDRLTPQAPGGDTDSGDTTDTLLNQLGGGGNKLIPGPTFLVGVTPDGRESQPLSVSGGTIETIAQSGDDRRDLLSDDLQAALTEAGVYRSIWADVRNKLAIGWTEQDVEAVIRWSGGGARFTARIREGSKAPSKYYKSTLERQVELDDDPDLTPEQAAEVDGLVAQDGARVWADDDQAPEAPDWWIRVVDQLDTRAPWRLTLLDASLSWELGGLRVGVPYDQADELGDRLTRYIERALVGVLGREAKVEIVAREAGENEGL